VKTDIKGKWAIITGADGGIGREFSRNLASRGCNLLLVGNRGREIELLAHEIKGKFDVDTRTLELDLTLQDAARRIDDFLEENWIEPEICINNAGVFAFAPMSETSESKINTFINLHIRAVTEISTRIGRGMAVRGHGYILNMSSMSCWMPMPGIALYSATKAYIRVFSRALRCELKGSGVSVTVACPGGIATALFGLPPRLMRIAVALGALQTPGKFADRVISKMLHRKAMYINGALNKFSIFLVGITPEKIRMLVKSRMLDKGIRR